MIIKETVEQMRGIVQRGVEGAEVDNGSDGLGLNPLVFRVYAHI
jgi:hypothetical protein